MAKLSFKTTTLACRLGSIIQAITVMMPSVLFVIFQEDYGLTYAQLAFLILMTFVLQILVDLLLSETAHKFRARVIMILSCVLPIIGYGLLALSPTLFPGHTFIGLLLACFFYSCGSGINEVMTSPLTDAMPNEDKGSSMAFLHSFYCWGCMLAILMTTLLLKLLGRENWPWIPIIFMIVPVVDLILFSVVPFPEMVSGHEEGNGRQLFKSVIFWAAIMVMISSGASEQAMSQWASLFVQKGLGLNKTLGDLIGPCFFSLMMGVGRLFYGFRGDKLDMKKALMISGGLCVVSYVLVVLSPSSWLSLAGLGLCGLSVSMMWPGTLVLSSKAMPKGGTQMFALMALAGDVGCSAGPWLTGIISDGLTKTSWGEALHMSLDQFALKGGLLVALLFPVILLVFLPIMTSHKKAKTIHE